MKTPGEGKTAPTKRATGLTLMALLQGLGVGTALVFHSLYPLMSPSRLVYYHSSTDMHSVVLACSLDWLLVACAYFLLRKLLLRTRGWPVARFALSALLPWMLLIQDPSLLNSAWSHLRAGLHLAAAPVGYGVGTLPVAMRYVVLGLWVVVLALMLRFSRRDFHRTLAAGGIGLVALGIFAVPGAFSMARAWQWRPDSGLALPLLHGRATTEAHARVVWIILDELSYEQAFARRPPDLALPNFDRLAAQSNVYSNVQPIGYWTEMVIPSLLVGSPISAVRASRSTQMLIGDAHGNLSLYPAQQTLTAEAQRLGWNVGIAGWYNPYCAILSGTFQSCFWTDRENPSGPMLTAATVPRNMLDGLRNHLSILSFGAPDLGVDLARSEDELLFAHADALLRDDAMDFLFLHFPLPHPPGVWDRRTNSWASESGASRPGSSEASYVASYEDNLVLADRELGHILDQLQAGPRWSRTTVVVQGDHGWRVAMWHGHPSWTREDEVNSRGGTFDNRPALLVHAPGQTTEQMVAAPTSLMRAHDMVQAALRTGTPLSTGDVAK